MLGLNDFRNINGPIDFSQWNTRMEALLKSYKAAVPNGRLVVCTPCSSCGSLNNKAGDFSTRQNAQMWEARRNVIQMFDKRESEGVYVVDASITISNDYGYKTMASELPFDGYTGDSRLLVQQDNPHPYFSYPSLALPIAAFVQIYRDR